MAQALCAEECVEVCNHGLCLILVSAVGYKKQDEVRRNYFIWTSTPGFSTEPGNPRGKQKAFVQLHSAGKQGARNRPPSFPSHGLWAAALTVQGLPEHGNPACLPGGILPSSHPSHCPSTPNHRQLKNFNGRNVCPYLSYHHVETSRKNTFWVLCSGKNSFLVRSSFSLWPTGP